MKDLPAEARNDFRGLTGHMRVYQCNRIDPEEVKEHIASLTDAEVTAAISKIIAMHGAVACYQPSLRHATALQRPLPFVWLMPAWPKSLIFIKAQPVLAHERHAAGCNICDCT
jgi:hypothetical protein